jgi:hypothetical protein
MDADWSVEIGDGLPWIEAPWEGWVDLRDRATAAEKMHALAEVVAYPELAEVLLEINTNHTMVLTSKCDVFPIDIGSTPSLMMDDTGPDHDQDVHCGLGSYIDLVFSTDDSLCNFAWYESLVRRISTELLAPIPMPRVSVEIVIRQSSLFSVEGYGLSLYAMGFGRNPMAARSAWAHVMRFSAYITMLEITSRVTEKLKQDHGE